MPLCGHNFLSKLIINSVRTGLQLVPVGDWTMAPDGSRRVEVAGLTRCISQLHLHVYSVENSSLRSSFIRAKLSDVIPSLHFHIHLSSSDWVNKDTVKIFFEKVFVPYLSRIQQEKQTTNQKALLIMDNFVAHYTGDVVQPLIDSGLLLLLNTTDRLQLLDLSINQPLRTSLGTSLGTGMRRRFPRVSRVQKQ